MALGDDSTCNTNEYQIYLLAGKGGRCVELATLPPSYADCPEILRAPTSRIPYGPSEACAGIENC